MSVDARVVRPRRKDASASRMHRKIDTDSLSVDCSVTQCRGIETAMRKILHRTTGNEPLRVVHQVQGQEGFPQTSCCRHTFRLSKDVFIGVVRASQPAPSLHGLSSLSRAPRVICVFLYERASLKLKISDLNGQLCASRRNAQCDKGHPVRRTNPGSSGLVAPMQFENALFSNQAIHLQKLEFSRNPLDSCDPTETVKDQRFVTSLHLCDEGCRRLLVLDMI